MGKISGLIGYNPGPGIYSRLERAIEEMPANVRVQELPGLLRRYKEGVPGWEIKQVLTPDLTEGVQSVPRRDLLDAVKKRSPVYTHSEVVLGNISPENFSNDIHGRIGSGNIVERPVYADLGQGGADYRELLLRQPRARSDDFKGHWWTVPGGNQAVAHARYDIHGDALRINELQSDLAIHNRKAREFEQEAAQLPEDELAARYQEQPTSLPFPLEDAWLDILIKRLMLETARGGHRAIELASPSAISRGAPGMSGTGMDVDKLDHLMHKMVAPRIEKLGRAMGGLSLAPSGTDVPRDLFRPEYPGRPAVRETVSAQPSSAGSDFVGGPFWNNYSEMMHANLSPLESDRVYQEFGGWGNYGRSEGQAAADMYGRLVKLGYAPQEAQAITSRALFEAPHAARVQANYIYQKELPRPLPPSEVSRRYIMSDAMRRRILETGIGASVALPLLSSEDLIERLGE